MTALYSQADVDRWVVKNARTRQILDRRLSSSWRNASDAQGLSLLSLTLQSEGYTAVALGDRDVAMNRFGESVAVTTKLLDMGRRRIGKAEGYIRTGYFQTLLIAWAVGNDRLIHEFLDVFQVDGIAAELSPPDSTYIARAMKALSTGRRDDAKQMLADPVPEIDAQFSGYVDCLNAITEGHWDELEIALRRAADAWERFTREDCPGQPQSVCFMAGLGLLNLAERQGLQPRTLTFNHIPSLLR